MTVAIIGGSGFDWVSESGATGSHLVETPYGEISAPIVDAEVSGCRILLLKRHGERHQIPPHLVNYRANIWALENLGAKEIISVNAVGAIDKNISPTTIALPDQLVDYTCNRLHTYWDESREEMLHVDMTEPFDSELRLKLMREAEKLHLNCISGVVYGCTQGPRLETAAEIKRLQNDGCDLVGMTVMPEAGLARELNIPYVSICSVANLAAGIDPEANQITVADTLKNISDALVEVRSLLKSYLSNKNT